ncbi:MAG: Eukaryotic-type DNA primase large subunit PRI2 [Candidatus Methanohalarchaeum thermophilum]|uniref:DNA primase large subunit PriL n=1 Tax=Methanohalarchaeum thermophilum TaxID=1903181 RepID=A0A1Q6DW98_METT1|nr:MAG: Eukaryotic-type DNA primase large subunit PRI2 [Candidatus Methanohalarchaeum thermophilum]
MDKLLIDYPFLDQAREYVQGLDVEIEEIIDKKSFSSARSRAKNRVVQAIQQGQVKPIESKLNKPKFLKEIFSYPVARIIVSCIDKNYLINKYVHGETELFYDRLIKESEKKVKKIIDDLEIDYKLIKTNKRMYSIHFTDYLSLTRSLKGKEWKLTNQRLKDGYISLEEKKFYRILKEGIKNKIKKDLPLDVSDAYCSKLNKYIEEINEVLEEQRSRYRHEYKKEGIIEENLFPPCIKELISDIKQGKNLSHPARFTLVSFLSNIGMEKNRIKQVFELAPDYEPEKTEYQIDHISGGLSGTEYTPPSCSTMKTYGICRNEDWRCKKVQHPLSYYDWALKSTEKEKSEEKDEEEN